MDATTPGDGTTGGHAAESGPTDLKPFIEAALTPFQLAPQEKERIIKLHEQPDKVAQAFQAISGKLSPVQKQQVGAFLNGVSLTLGRPIPRPICEVTTEECAGTYLEWAELDLGGILPDDL